MTFESFCKEVKDHILSYLPQEYADSKVKIVDALKNNGVKLTGLVIKGEKNITPNIYLEPFYNQMAEGKELSSVMEKISEIYQEHQKMIPEFDTASFSYENVKDKLFISVVNAKKNEKLLQNVPHEIKEDLALIYRAKMGIDSSQGMGSVLIHNAHLDNWGVTKDELQIQAKTSMKEHFPVQLKTMGETLQEIMSYHDRPETEIPEQPFFDDGMYVLSNSQRLHGAAYMFDEDVLSMISNKVGGNFAILPSSVHETLIIKEQQELDFDMLRDMVKEVNGTAVAEEEILSDSVYYYDAETQKISLVEEKGQSMGMGMDM